MRCPSGWVYFNDYCYFLSRNKANWTSSLEYCLNYKSSLIDIDYNPTDYDYPKKLFDFLNYIGLKERVWVYDMS